MAARKKEVFSVTKAVKSLARDRVGTPPPGQVLPDEKTKAEHRASKHRVTLTRMLDQNQEDTAGHAG